MITRDLERFYISISLKRNIFVIKFYNNYLFNLLYNKIEYCNFINYILMNNIRTKKIREVLGVKE